MGDSPRKFCLLFGGPGSGKARPDARAPQAHQTEFEIQTQKQVVGMGSEQALGRIRKAGSKGLSGTLESLSSPIKSVGKTGDSVGQNLGATKCRKHRTEMRTGISFVLPPSKDTKGCNQQLAS